MKKAMRHQGKITKWKDDQGFGFILPKDGGQQVFVHIRSFMNRHRRPGGNEIVTYELKTDAAGRLQAEKVVFLGERLPAATVSGRSNVPLLVVAIFMALVTGLVYSGKLPPAVLWLYLAASAIAFVAYAWDKSAAQKDEWRIAENTLHLFALAGGWPGALLAQRLLRHKSRKPSFLVVFWATVAANCGALGWLFGSSGAETLRAILGVA